MRYVLQVYFNDAEGRLAQLPEAEREAIVREFIAFFAQPEVRDGNQLQPPATATTVHVEGGRTLTTEGPFAPAAEPLGGYYLVDADDVDAAIALAARIPVVRLGAAIEVRPVVEG
jgi:hypothetical protein